jgi:cytochrome oxidase Cu insertion factor (SCO1/SenC/PrrC family)
MSYKKIYWIFALIAVFLSGCCCAGSNSKVKEGSIAPGFSLKDTDGKTFDLGRLKGKVVFLNFWRSG